MMINYMTKKQHVSFRTVDNNTIGDQSDELKVYLKFQKKTQTLEEHPWSILSVCDLF
ncbi:hypothetical protein Plhal304r1_c018g0064101 [Plasmopara halstedii]